MKAYQKETELTDSEYEEVLNDIYGEIEICGMHYPAGYALREIDPTAFRCDKSDYESNLDEENPIWVCSECDSEYDNEEEAEEGITRLRPMMFCPV